MPPKPVTGTPTGAMVPRAGPARPNGPPAGSSGGLRRRPGEPVKPRTCSKTGIPEPVPSENSGQHGLLQTSICCTGRSLAGPRSQQGAQFYTEEMPGLRLSPVRPFLCAGIHSTCAALVEFHLHCIADVHIGSCTKRQPAPHCSLSLEDQFKSHMQQA